MPRKKSADDSQLVGFLGVGFDHEKGEHRVTRGEHFVLIGGSQETHEAMQDTAMKVTEALDKTGKPLAETPIQEFLAIFREAQR